MRTRRFTSFILMLVLTLTMLPAVSLVSTTEVHAAVAFYDGGEIVLPTTASSQQFWIYKGKSGQFTLPDDATVEAFDVDDSDVLSVNADGDYKAKSTGATTLTVELEDSDVLTFKIHVVEYPSSLKLSPRKKTETKPTQDATTPMQTKFKIGGVKISSGDKIDIAVTDGTMTPSITRSGNVVTLTSTRGGVCTVTVTYNGVETPFEWTLNGISAEPVLLSPGKSTVVSVLHSSPRKFKWTSADKEIATVSSTGRISAKENGNVVIMGRHKTEGYKVGCVVSVTSESMVKAVTSAKEIGSGTYSQAKRMQAGYYDCSSLVYRAYSPVGYKFGATTSYAPTAAAEAQYLDARDKIYANWSAKDMQKMRYEAGDMMFRTDTGNGRYRGINHVEVIAGYEVVNFDKKGNATVLCTWATRNPEYSYTIFEHDIIGKV